MNNDKKVVRAERQPMTRKDVAKIVAEEWQAATGEPLSRQQRRKLERDMLKRRITR